MEEVILEASWLLQSNMHKSDRGIKNSSFHYEYARIQVSK